MSCRHGCEKDLEESELLVIYPGADLESAEGFTEPPRQKFMLDIYMLILNLLNT